MSSISGMISNFMGYSVKFHKTLQASIVMRLKRLLVGSAGSSMFGTTRAMQVMILRMSATRCPTLQSAAENLLCHQAAYVQWQPVMMLMKGKPMFRTTRGMWNPATKNIR